MFDYNTLKGNTSEKSLQLREMAGGVIETQLTEDVQQKPVGIVSDGSAVLGLGDIGGVAGMPVMEGKAVLFQELGGVSAMPLYEDLRLLKLLAALRLYARIKPALSPKTK